MNKPPFKKKKLYNGGPKIRGQLKRKKNRGILRQNLNIGPNFTFFFKINYIFQFWCI
jgi:hypothetical protein